MTDRDFETAFEQIIAPIKQLFAEMTTRGNKFCYPFIYRDEDGDYLSYIVRLIKQFVVRVKQLDEACIYSLNKSFDKLPEEYKPEKDFDFLRDVDALANMVIDVLTDNYRCYPDDAYQKLKSFFENDNCFYLNMLPQLQIHKGVFYRIRTGSFDKNNDGEIFHIPFEKRHLVTTQRYSIPGYPILYLSSSLFTAWCEMDKPEIDGMSFAAFEFKDLELFIDLGYPYMRTMMWEWYSLFVMYPLLMACMVRVKNPSAPFKPEYIMPQMMMKLVREHGQRLSGIAYMSNKLPEAFPIDSISSRNLAVCTNNCLCIKGHDKTLADRMRMTDIQTITRDQVRESVAFDAGKFLIDFQKLQSYNSGSLRDINVEMKIG